MDFPQGFNFVLLLKQIGFLHGEIVDKIILNCIFADCPKMGRRYLADFVIFVKRKAFKKKDLVLNGSGLVEQTEMNGSEVKGSY